ncbi:GIY-YIG nuclease family protein [Janthinobacterium sp. PSPC3-1]|uniref:GIY-YIG nuclease family protein n=1 Tax=Janthinobacterium sp. PSPC3-1 TaxID=2804653 RepID=UPI003CF161D7
MIKAISIAETGYPGVTKITADGWDGQVLRMSYATCCKWIASSAQLQQAGVYMLYADHFDRATHGNQLYVGQSGTIGQRLGQHDGKKVFWTAVMVFSSAGDWMNVAYTVNIERQFIKWAKHANRYELDNRNVGREEYLGQEDQARLESFLAGVQPVLRLAGIDVFEPNMDGTFSYSFPNKVTSQLKILNGSPTPAVTILAGSRIFGLDQAKVSQANLNGVAHDDAGRIHTFHESVDVTLDGPESILKLFDRPVASWKSRSGISLMATLTALHRAA